MHPDDVDLLERWDDDPDVVAALGGRGSDWYDWHVELARDVPWRELLVAVERDRVVGFVQLVDAAEETHYWGEVEPDTWALDVWIGDASDRGRGLGTAIMRAALRRVFDRHGASCLVIDPQVSNERAIEFYRRLGFDEVGVREFDDDRCLVMRVDRPTSGTG